MEVIIKDERDNELKNLGFMTIKDDEKYIHCSVDILTSGNVYFKNFINGSIGKYNFKRDTYYTNRGKDNGFAFIGAGRGRKPDKSFDEMRNFIREVNELNIVLDDSHKIESKKNKQYAYEF